MKLHYQKIKSTVSYIFINIPLLLLSVLAFYIVMFLFFPVRLISIGFIKKLTKPLLALEDILTGFFLGRIFYALYTLIN